MTFPPWAWTLRWCILWQNGSAWPCKRYNFTVGKGLYTDMNAIRRDEALDNLHSIYVDQWDWEKIITPENRNLDYPEAHRCAPSWVLSATPTTACASASPSCAPS